VKHLDVLGGRTAWAAALWRAGCGLDRSRGILELDKIRELLIYISFIRIRKRILG
jgi:hypothetical protein